MYKKCSKKQNIEGKQFNTIIRASYHDGIFTRVDTKLSKSPVMLGSINLVRVHNPDQGSTDCQIPNFQNLFDPGPVRDSQFFPRPTSFRRCVHYQVDQIRIILIIKIRISYQIRIILIINFLPNF